jgi:glucose/mannose-6-phosphate isomerase
MLGHVARLGDQMRQGYALGRSVGDLPSGEGVRSIVVCGMGGSGLAGDVLRALYAERSPVPIVVVKGAALPEFCGRDSVVFAVSFSGNTDETITTYAEAVARGCRVVAVSAGGELAMRSHQDRVPHVRIPNDVPVPRAAVGYLAAVPIGVLEVAGLIPSVGEAVASAARLVDGMAAGLGPARATAENPAKDLASWVDGRTVVIWGSEGIGEAAALRWKNQVNENAKLPAFAATLPELSHNDVEGWSAGTGRTFALLVLDHPGESHPMAERATATIDAVAGSGLEVRRVHAAGAGPLEWLSSLVLMADFTSTYLAVIRGVDPTPIPVLTGLKRRLRG